MGGILPPILFPAKDSAERRWLAELRASGRIRKIGPRLYSSVTPAEDAATVRKLWSTIVSELHPGALLTHRTALEFLPSESGEVFITGSTNRTIEYPGLKLCFFRGPPPLDDDPPFLRLRSSSLSRALLENLSTTHPSTRSKTVETARLEERLERLLRVGGETELNAIRDRAREIALEFDWAMELERLDGVIGTLLGTRSEHLESAVARARSVGEPFDASCVQRLGLLFAELRTKPTQDLVDDFQAPDHFRNKAFFEAYFSNYIEGTTFEIDEAEAIVFDGKVPAARPKDAHDIMGTFAILSDLDELRRTPTDLDSLVRILQERHRKLLGERPDVEPGTFKSRPNRAGDTHFVAPDSVIGTLRKGFDLYRDLSTGLQRAAFMMFLIADVHPFVDGNGRIARIMMTAELASARRTTIIIPTVYRDDYLQALRALTRRHRPGPLVDMVAKAQRFSHLEFSPYPTVLAHLEARNWFREPDDARIVMD